MMRLLIFNDPHFSITPPACRTDEFPQQVLKKIHWIRELSEKLKVNAVACTGDLFHRKHAVTFREASQLAAVLKTFPCLILTVLGNHDAPSPHSFDARAVGVLVRSGVVQLLDHEPWEHITSLRSLGTVVTGRSWKSGADADPTMLTAKNPKVGFHVHLCHAALRLPGVNVPPFDVIDVETALLELEYVPDVIVAGHYHIDQGIREIPLPGGRRVTVASIGSLSRVSVDDIQRRPSVLLVARVQEKTVLKRIDIPVDEIEAKEVSEEVLSIEHDIEAMEKFLAEIGEETEESWMVDPEAFVRKAGEEMQASDAAIEIAVRVLREAETDAKFPKVCTTLGKGFARGKPREV